MVSSVSSVMIVLSLLTSMNVTSSSATGQVPCMKKGTVTYKDPKTVGSCKLGALTKLPLASGAVVECAKGYNVSFFQSGKGIGTVWSCTLAVKSTLPVVATDGTKTGLICDPGVITFTPEGLVKECTLAKYR